jgi:fumarate reductase flavoprotein subunit
MPASSYDIIVVGSGSAGLAAAISAAENGACTLIIEKNAMLGGTTAWSVGSITTSASSHQRAIDIYDTPDDHYADMALFHGERLKGHDNLKLRRLLVDHTPATFDWLLSLGLVFYGPMPEPPHSQPRMHNILPNSRMLIHHLTKRARKLGVKIRTSAPMEKLVVETNRVTGIVVNGEHLTAEKAVILAAGDFSANPALKQRYMPPEVARIGPFNEDSTGDWHAPVTQLGGRALNGDVALGPEIRFRPPTKLTLVRKLPPWLWLARVVR